MERIEAEQAAVWEQVKDADKVMVAKGGTFGGRNVYGPLLVLLKADKLAVLVRCWCMKETDRAVLVRRWCTKETEGAEDGRLWCICDNAKAILASIKHTVLSPRRVAAKLCVPCANVQKYILDIGRSNFVCCLGMSAIAVAYFKEGSADDHSLERHAAGNGKLFVSFGWSQVMHEVVNLCLADGNKGVPTLKACKQVAELVQQEVRHARRVILLVWRPGVVMCSWVETPWPRWRTHGRRECKSVIYSTFFKLAFEHDAHGILRKYLTQQYDLRLFSCSRVGGRSAGERS